MVPFEATAARVPRAVPVAHVAAWYRDALALFKRAPGRFMLLALATFGTDFVLTLIPLAGASLANMIVPPVACGLLYASLAADRNEPVRLRFALLAFAARVDALAAVILASLVMFCAQAAAAAWLEGVNLLAPDGSTQLSPAGLVAVMAVGIAASLPVTFVPLATLFDGARIGPAFESSLAAARGNVLPLLVYGFAAFVLMMLGIATYGAALLIVLPVLAASSYAAWKDIFAIRG